MKRFLSLTLCVLLLLLVSTGCGDMNNDASSTPSAGEMRYTASQILDTVKSAYGSDYLPDTEMLEDRLNDEFPIDKALVKEIRAEMPTLGTTPDRLVAVVANDGKGEEVENALKAARNSMIAGTSVTDDGHAKVSASRVVRNGDYVCYIMLGANNVDDTISESAKLDYAKRQVNRGVNAFNSMFA